MWNRCFCLLFDCKNESAIGIHCELCSVYGEDVMSIQMVHCWRQMFIDSREDVHNEICSSQTTTSDNFLGLPWSIDDWLSALFHNNKCSTSQWSAAQTLSCYLEHVAGPFVMQSFAPLWQRPTTRCSCNSWASSQFPWETFDRSPDQDKMTDT